MTAEASPRRTVFAFFPPRGIVALVFVGAIGAEIARSARPLIRAGDNDNIVAAVFAIIVLGCLLVSAVGLIGAVYVYGRRFVNVRRVQTDRDHYAAALLTCLDRDEAPPSDFALYLRPFFADRRFALTGDGSLDYNAVRFGGAKSLEGLVADALDKQKTLLAIGGLHSGRGPGRVVVPDDRWQAVFQQLAHAAPMIVAMPFAQSATAWEIETLAEGGLLHKVMFVVPPLNTRMRGQFRGQKTKTTADIYNASRRQFRDVGILMPGLGEWGGIFRIDADGAVQGLNFGSKEDFYPDRLGSYFAQVERAEKTWPAAVEGPAVDGASKYNRWLHLPRWAWNLVLVAVVMGGVYLYSGYESARWDQRLREEGRIAVAQISDTDWQSQGGGLLLARTIDASSIGAISRAADSGDARAQFLAAYGMVFRSGGFGQADLDRALRLARESAEAGEARGQVLLALIYLHRVPHQPDVERREAEAVALLEQATAAGSGFGMGNLAMVLESEPDAPQSQLVRAYDLYVEACRRQAFFACSRAGLMLLLGSGPDRDADAYMARRFFEIGEVSGDAVAMYGLGMLHLNGEAGFERSWTDAEPYLISAARSGVTHAQNLLAERGIAWLDNDQ